MSERMYHESFADGYLQEIASDVLREMYAEADPPLDFDDVIENPAQYRDEWYKNHVLPSVRQREIVDKHCERLSKQEKALVLMTAIVDLGPRSTPLGEDDD